MSSIFNLHLLRLSLCFSSTFILQWIYLMKYNYLLTSFSFFGNPMNNDNCLCTFFFLREIVYAHVHSHINIYVLFLENSFSYLR